MSNSSDAAEQIVHFTLEGVEVAAKITGEAARDIAGLIAAAIKNPKNKRTKGRARLSRLLKSGKELTVFSLKQRDLEQFTRNAKKYGVLYTVLRDRTTKKHPDAEIDIIARAEDGSKIQRIIERFGLNLTEEQKATIVNESQKELEERAAKEKDKPEKSKSELVAEKALGKPVQKEENEQENPSLGSIEKDPLSEPQSRKKETSSTINHEGVAKPSVKEKIDAYRAQIKKEKEEKAREGLEVDLPKKAEKPRVTEHEQPIIPARKIKTEKEK